MLSCAEQQLIRLSKISQLLQASFSTLHQTIRGVLGTKDFLKLLQCILLEFLQLMDGQFFPPGVASFHERFGHLLIGIDAGLVFCSADLLEQALDMCEFFDPCKLLCKITLRFLLYQLADRLAHATHRIDNTDLLLEVRQTDGLLRLTEDMLAQDILRHSRNQHVTQPNLECGYIFLRIIVRKLDPLSEALHGIHGNIQQLCFPQIVHIVGTSQVFHWHYTLQILQDLPEIVVICLRIRTLEEADNLVEHLFNLRRKLALQDLLDVVGLPVQPDGTLIVFRFGNEQQCHIQGRLIGIGIGHEAHNAAHCRGQAGVDRPDCLIGIAVIVLACRNLDHHRRRAEPPAIHHAIQDRSEHLRRNIEVSPWSGPAVAGQTGGLTIPDAVHLHFRHEGDVKDLVKPFQQPLRRDIHKLFVEELGRCVGHSALNTADPQQAELFFLHADLQHAMVMRLALCAILQKILGLVRDVLIPLIGNGRFHRNIPIKSRHASVETMIDHILPSLLPADMPAVPFSLHEQIRHTGLVRPVDGTHAHLFDLASFARLNLCIVIDR